MGNFDTTSSFAIILLAAVTHASFQLSVSVLTLMSGHALGRKTAHLRLLHLTGSYILGAGVMTLMLLSTMSLIITTVLPTSTPFLLWAIACGAVVGVGICVWLFYYRGRGTTLWIPRNFARFLNDRSKHSKSSAETFGLGLTTIFAEILFVFAPIFVTALVLVRLDPLQQLLGIVIYTGISLLPLLVVGAMIGGGHKLSNIQRWRESNKKFLQFAAGSGLLILGTYVYVERVIVSGVAAIATGGGQ